MGDEELKSKVTVIDADDFVVVVVGHMDSGLSFYGPFEGEDSIELAERFIKEKVHPSLPAQWAYMSSPALFGDDDVEQCNVCGSENICECEVKPVEVKSVKQMKKPVEKSLPSTEPVIASNGKKIGDQLVLA